MLQKLSANDPLLSEELFMKDEVQYNLIHRITESEDATCLKYNDGTMVFAQTPGNNGWLWIADQVADEQRKVMIKQLIDYLGGTPSPGITGEPRAAEMFAWAFSEVHNVEYHSYKLLQAYCCPQIVKANIPGRIQAAAEQHVETIAEFLAGFLQAAYEETVDPVSQLAVAEGMIKSGNLHLWIVDERPVSMANIAHRAPRQARINAVYTPASYRKNGYATAIVTGLCAILESESLVPMLYADSQNPDANKIYKKIGFVESGQVLDIRFTTTS
ncbi:hypothetical protein SD71_20380 [Cohnella kolymensis]|uniref:N-acetyltransferase domain-containing protein n=1 Tax=Cohnella kolymensis TaxID=1590652 RepID=A0ABR5A157_9BACL|nr:GNAT family N-acetyltransferase [Cohnella kolymensis]KIL34383.1 hypothetical protein SD71_20380 [Cohnella kolymensis]